MDYSQLQGQNLTRGWYQHYCYPIDDDGVSLAERQWEEQQKKVDRQVDELMERIIEEMPLIGYNVPEFPGDETFVSARMKREVEGWYPGYAPIGYLNARNETNDKIIIPDPIRFPLIKKIWQLFLSGAYSVPELCKAASDDLALRTRKHKKTGGRPRKRRPMAS